MGKQKIVRVLGFSGFIWFDVGRLRDWYCGKSSVENDHVGNRHTNDDFWWCFGGFCGHLRK